MAMLTYKLTVGAKLIQYIRPVDPDLYSSSPISQEVALIGDSDIWIPLSKGLADHFVELEEIYVEVSDAEVLDWVVAWGQEHGTGAMFDYMPLPIRMAWGQKVAQYQQQHEPLTEPASDQVLVK